MLRPPPVDQSAAMPDVLPQRLRGAERDGRPGAVAGPENDPLYEFGFLLFGHQCQEQFWHHTLRSLAAQFGVKGQVWMARACLEPRWQWSGVWNTWHNASIRAALYQAAAPLRRPRRFVSRSSPAARFIARG
jgi:hypothetical protein